MKRLMFLLVLSISFVAQTLAQTATNADGSIKFRGNVAVIANCEMFDFIDGKAIPSNAERKVAMDDMATALRTLSQAKFGDIAFGIVNRDDNAMKQVMSVLGENKLEDYINGYSVQAKNQGADWLFIINLTLLNYDNLNGQIFLDSRLVNVENNLGYHHHYASPLFNVIQMTEQASKITKDFTKDLEAFLFTIFPEQYYIIETKGKNMFLGAYQPNGRILPSDKFYIYQFKKESMEFGGQGLEEQIIESIGIASDPKVENGKLVVKSDTKISGGNDIVLMRNLPEVSIFQPMFKVTYFGIDYDSENLDGFARQRVNNAMLSAITDNPFIQLIEQEAIEELHKERELQKSEDFLNGHTVNQMKAIGAEIILKVDNYQTDGQNASFVLSVIDVASNQIVKQTEIKSSIDNLELAIRKNLYDRFISRASIGSLDKKIITLNTLSSIPTGTKLEFMATVEQRNPMTGETGYTNATIATGEVISSNGQQSIVKLLSKTDIIKDFKDLLDYSKANNFLVKIDGSEISIEESSKDKNQKPKKSFLNKLGNALDAVSSAVDVSIK